MTGGGASGTTWTVARAATLGAVAWALLALLGLAFTEGALRVGLLVGVVTGGLGGVAGFAVLGRVLGRPLAKAFQALVLSMMVRMGLVAGGLLLTVGPLDGEPLAYVGAVFTLFFGFVVLEMLVVVGSARRGQVAR